MCVRGKNESNKYYQREGEQRTEEEPPSFSVITFYFVSGDSIESHIHSMFAFAGLNIERVKPCTKIKLQEIALYHKRKGDNRCGRDCELESLVNVQVLITILFIDGDGEENQ